MTIESVRGDLLAADVDALVNTVNCVGFMGRGIAAQFKKVWPDNFRAYAAACRAGDVQPGRMFTFDTGRMVGPRYVINFPTKRHWRGKSRMEDIEAGLVALVAEVRTRGIRSLAVPPLGAGLGGLPWPAVRERIERALGELEGVRVLLYEPHGAHSKAPSQAAKRAAAMSPGRASVVGLMERYLVGLMEPYVSLLEVHKLMYFMQEAGEDLKLKVSKGHYGPYVENLRFVLHELEGVYLTGYGDGGDQPDKILELKPGAVEAAKAELAQSSATAAHFRRVVELVDGFESPFGMELLATVHWVQTQEGARTAEQAIEATYAWGERKRRFSPDQIRLASDVLRERGFVEA